MKQNFKLIFSLVMLLLCSSSRITAQQPAADYLASISREFELIQQKSWEYTRAAAHVNTTRKVEKKRRELLEAAEAGLARVKLLKPFDGSSALRDSAISYLFVQLAVVSEDYTRLVDIEKISEGSYDAMEAYMLAKLGADERAAQSSQMINTEMQRFAKANNISLQPGDSRLAANLAAAEKAFRHFNEVYHLFFVSYKQEAYFMEAMQKNDVSGLEQNRDALSDVSEKGLQSLAAMESHAGDESLLRACEKVLRFYKQEADEKLQAVSAYFVAMDNFGKMKTSFEAGAASDQNEEAKRIYNAALSEQKAANEQFTKINSSLDIRRRAVIKSWHAACDNFIRKHVPAN